MRRIAPILTLVALLFAAPAAANPVGGLAGSIYPVPTLPPTDSQLADDLQLLRRQLQG